MLFTGRSVEALQISERKNNAAVSLTPLERMFSLFRSGQLFTNFSGAVTSFLPKGSQSVGFSLNGHAPAPCETAFHSFQRRNRPCEWL
jgi:hypothetical protein